MRVLGLDTALLSCSVAVVDGERCLAWQFEERLRGHAERLMPMMEEVLAAAEVGFSELDLIAVTVGPGTFTGLRIGLAAARGLALALTLPLVGLTTLEVTAVAAYARRQELLRMPLAVIHDARRDEVYVEIFSVTGEEGGLPIVASMGAAAALPLDSVAAALPQGGCAIVGTGIGLVGDRLPGTTIVIDDSSLAHPDPRIIARLGRRGLGVNNAADVRPFYLRPPDAKLPAA